jgi:hypothetical protein
MRHVRGLSLTGPQQLLAAACAIAGLTLSAVVWLGSMRSGVSALERMSD